MNKKLSLLCILGCFSQVAWAADINLGNLTQSQFKDFSEDLGAALSYKPITPTAPLGITGFDLGLEVTTTKMRNLNIATNDSSLNNLIVPKLHIYKGLPLNFDVGAFYGAEPSTNVKLYGGELRYAIIEGGVAEPAVGIRGAMTKLTGVNQLSMNTKSVDLSVSKGFAIFTPYAGIGRVWVDSTPDGVSGLSDYSFQLSKVFVGGNLNFGLVNLALEYDKTGATSYSAKLGFRF